jgi:transposase
MPKAIPVPIRRRIVERHQQDESLPAIAKDLGLPFETVRGIWRRYRDRGEVGLQPDYDKCGKRGIRSPKLVYRAAIWLKRAHPKWGATLIKLLIEEKWPALETPHARTLQRWFRAAGVDRRHKRRVTGQNHARGKAVHEVWQMDAKEQIQLADGSEGSWLSLTDEQSGAIIAAGIFPPGAMDEGDTARGAGQAAAGLRQVGASPTDTG